MSEFSMFPPGVEKLLMQALNAFIGEYGAENIIVHVPEKWKDETLTTTLGQAKLIADAVGCVVIEVKWFQVNIKHTARLSIAS